MTSNVITRNLGTSIAQVIGGVVLLIAASKILIPIEPVPITLQPTAVLLLGLTYSRNLAISSLMLWLGLGALGAPVFAGVNPVSVVMFGPTGGYIMGYIPVLIIVPTILEKVQKLSWSLYMVLCTLATIIVYANGVFWLSYFVGFEKSIELGLLPFIIPGFVKAILLSTVLYIISAKHALR